MGNGNSSVVKMKIVMNHNTQIHKLHNTKFEVASLEGFYLASSPGKEKKGNR